MKRMSWLLLLAPGLAFGSLPSLEMVDFEILPKIEEEKPSARSQYTYLSVGASPMTYPSFGLGWRRQMLCFGVDLGLRSGSWVEACGSFHAHGNLVLYTSPSKNTSFYFGSGVGALTAVDFSAMQTDMVGLVNGLIGVEFGRKSGHPQFVQIDTGFPLAGTYKSSGNIYADALFPIIYPMGAVTLSYGFGF